MDYEFGILFGMEDYEPCGTSYSLEGAKRECAESEYAWSGRHINEWRFVRGRWVADTDNPNEFWYVREVQ